MSETDPEAGGGPITIEKAVDIAFRYVSKLQQKMKAELYGLEETEYDAEKGLFKVTVSLVREDAPKRVMSIGRSIISDIRPLSVSNPNFIQRVVEVQEATGKVSRMVDADR